MADDRDSRHRHRYECNPARRARDGRKPAREREARHAEEVVALSDPWQVGSDPGAPGAPIDSGGLLGLLVAPLPVHDADCEAHQVQGRSEDECRSHFHLPIRGFRRQNVTPCAPSPPSIRLEIRKNYPAHWLL